MFEIKIMVGRIAALFILILGTWHCSAQDSKIYFDNNCDLSLSIEMPKTIYSRSDKDVFETVLRLAIKNSSKGSFKIVGLLDNTTGFDNGIHFEKNEIRYTFLTQKYDSTIDFWETLDNQFLYNGGAWVVQDTTPEKTVNPGQILSEEIYLFKEWALLKQGKYRVQILLGVKPKADTFIVFSSNRLEIEMIK